MVVMVGVVVNMMKGMMMMMVVMVMMMVSPMRNLGEKCFEDQLVCLWR